MIRVGDTTAELLQCYACESYAIDVFGTKANCSDGVGDKVQCLAAYDACATVIDELNGHVQARLCVTFNGHWPRSTGCDYFNATMDSYRWVKYACICTTDLCNGSTSINSPYLHITLSTFVLLLLSQILK